MALDVRSSVGGNSFDFNSQAGVLAVLGAIRASALAVTERNELRDLVFLYSNGGGDPGVRTVLEERLREAGITPSMAPVKAVDGPPVPKPPVAAGFSGGRPVPVFIPAQPVPVPPVEVVAVPVPPPEPTPAQVPEPEVKAPVAAVIQPVVPRPVILVPRPVVPTSAQPVAEAVPVAPVVPPVPPVVSEPIVPITPITPTTPTPVAVVPDVINPAATARLERIRLIKSEVNSRVGNPVNLVDLDNMLGREYMSALLEAMKLIADAPDADADRAMNRLETVFAKVLTLLDSPKETPAAPLMPITPIVPTIPTPSIPAPVAPAPVETVAPWGEAESVADLAPGATAIPVRVLPASLNSSAIPPAPVTPPQPVSQMLVQSVTASQAPLRSISELPTADEVNSKNAGGDPLYTNEVDSGLQQLLSEWSLFKKSGLFGTGASGREHPLFLKIAPLPLPLLLAGRFEGSTQEIKQSVTDYMNGWRYEQGIVYEKDETFEHYLRRVIRHIIDLQNKKRGA